jgi:hypothetical protein
MLPELGHPVAALAHLPEWPGRLQEVPALGELHLAFGKGKWLPIVLLELGLVIEEVHVGGPAVHEEKDHPAGPGGKECLWSWGSARPGLLGQQGVEGETTEAEGHALKGGAAGKHVGSGERTSHRR